MRLSFCTLDVFTAHPFTGNPLAIVWGADGLPDTQLQAIAREFNLSETVFVFPPKDAAHRAQLRIFTPAHELPFAGHPTIGTAVCLAIRDEAEANADMRRGDAEIDRLLVLEEAVGPVRCAVKLPGSTDPAARRMAEARFDLPRLPSTVVEDWRPDPSGIAACLGLAAHDIGFSGHEITRVEAGVPYTLVPVRDLDALSRACVHMAGWREAFGPHSSGDPYLYTAQPGESGTFRSRMFSPDGGIPEDPATGSAAATFAHAIMRFERPADGHHVVTIHQGIEMGRPSQISLELDVEDQALVGARICGEAVMVSEGTLTI